MTSPISLPVARPVAWLLVAGGAALALLDESLRTDAATYPPEDVLRKLEAGMPLDADGQRRREALET